MNDTLCGPRCLWLAATKLGRDVSLESLISMAKVDAKKGTSVKNMLEVARGIGLTGQIVRTDVSAIGRDPRCAILIVDDHSHFVFVKDILGGAVTVIDGHEIKTLAADPLRKRWQGEAIMVGAPGRPLTGARGPVWGGWAGVAAGATLLLLAVGGLIRRARGNRRQSCGPGVPQPDAYQEVR